MPISPIVKKLYLAKSIEELNKRADYNLPSVKNSKNITKYIESATKLYEEAVKYDESGDEEKAYMLYMRYLAFYKTIRSTYKNKSDMKNNFDILQKNGKSAIIRAEALQVNLIDRYKNLKASEQLSSEKSIDVIPTRIDDDISEREKKEKLLINGQKSEKIIDKKISNSITSIQLFELMENSEVSLLILDVRPSMEYEKSYIKYDSCLNIPREILKPGITAKALEKELPDKFISMWNKRGLVDFVIILDWNSTAKNINFQHPLYTLREAIDRWDANKTLKSSPLILEGGYEDWLLHYPMYTTNPNVETLGSSIPFSLPELKVEINYPNLDDGFLEIPLSSPASFDGIEKSTITNKIDKSSFVNGSLKPNIDILDRTINVDKISNINTTYDSDAFEKPSVNRMLKPSRPVIAKSSEITSFEKSQNFIMPYSILKEEAILEENIKIEKECLDKEKEFELLRLKKICEAETGMRLEIQKQEGELLAKIKELEIEAKAKDLKHQKLKEENSQIKQELEKLKGMGKEVKSLQKLQQMEAEKKKLMEDVERLREERKKKEKNKFKEDQDNSDKIIELNSSGKEINDQSVTISEDYSSNIDHATPINNKNSEKSTRSLSRSHSSPNIAQMIAEEDKKYNEMSIPKIDRTLKPSRISESFFPSVNRSLKPEEINAARLRNLQPVYGNQGVVVTGLKNLGNTCFMNAVIQCLALTVPLSLYFTRGHYKNDINRDKKSLGGGVTEEFAIVIRALWNGVYKSIAPKDFKNTVSKYLSVCVGYEQQDSHEFLIVLLEKLHADLNKGNKISPKQRLNLDNLSDFEAQQRFWENHTIINKSIISNLFEGLLQSELMCLNCNKTSNSYEVFSLLSLPIPSTTKCYLKDCFEVFLKEEIMKGDAAWDCPQCAHKREAKKKMTICKVPKILVIHLKRFSFDGMWREKLQTFVDFPTDLELHSFVKYHKNPKYKLYGVLNHYGTLEGGHYIAYCKNSVYNRWYKYDDHEVYEMYEGDTKTSAAYMLFYSNMDFQQCLQN